MTIILEDFFYKGQHIDHAEFHINDIDDQKVEELTDEEIIEYIKRDLENTML